jgi:hypothetical protein
MLEACGAHQALADPLRTFATTRACPGAPRVRSGLESALGVPWKPHTVRYRLLAARAAPKHSEVEQQRPKDLEAFLKLPPGASWATSC